MRRASVVILAVALLVPACRGSEPTVADSDDAEVLGLQIEREADGARTFEPTEPATPTEAGVPATPEVSPEPTASPEPAPSAPPPTSPTTRPSPAPSVAAPAPPRPSPSPTPAPAPPEPSPSPDGPQALGSRQGHSYVTWFAEEEAGEDGTTRRTWGELSAAPAITRGAASEPLRVTLVDPTSSEAGDAVREARCLGFIEVDGSTAISAVGDVRVTVMVDGGPALDRLVPIDVTVAPGERVDLLMVGDVTVDPTLHDQVTCRITFAAR